jgi:ribulose-bisphosphate carboxylase large chain
MHEPVSVAGLSGERFTVTYLVHGDEASARAVVEAIREEQSVEFPLDLLPAGDIPDQILGRVESFEHAGEQRYRARISYANEIAGSELPQLLNVIFGNSSIKPGILVEWLDLSPGVLAAFKGPRFGRQGLRERLGNPERPLLCTAIKPMGLSAEALAEIAYQCALGGIDIIKDDHGLADQRFSPFKERVGRCAEAVEKANRETGGHAIYVPNVTGPILEMPDMARYARDAGAGGLMVSPGLSGYDIMRTLAEDDALGLPIVAHPTFNGSYVTCPQQGISHAVLYGQIARLAGADASIYPNYGGRFSFSKEECISIVRGTETPMGHIKPCFPTPGGGMSLERLPEMYEVYGQDVIYLIGGALHRSGNLAESSRNFVSMVTT